MSNTHVIDGVTYVEVDRRAEVGDYVFITEFDGNVVQEIRKVAKLVGSCPGDFYVDKPVGGYFEEYFDGDDDKCKTLEPLESEEVTVDSSQASPAVIEMFTALSRKIVSLERKIGSLEAQLADTQRNVERQAEELENAKHRISKHATMFGAVEEKVEMLTDDMITLDSRSQVLNAINKYYAEGSR